MSRTPEGMPQEPLRASSESEQPAPDKELVEIFADLIFAHAPTEDPAFVNEIAGKLARYSDIWAANYPDHPEVIYEARQQLFGDIRGQKPQEGPPVE